MSTGSSRDQALEHFQQDFDTLRREIAKVVVGQADLIDQVLIAAVAGGHVLVEGVPGLGKTLLVETLADVLQLRFNRIQFTPDLMPSDLLGTYVVMETPQGRRMFEFQKGPIFANMILADHINRGMPKTQSALLQAMEGEPINIGAETFHLPQPFFVMATQNPMEMEGTFPLPEPEIDRFFFKLAAAPPTCEEIGRHPGAHDRGRAAGGPSDRRRQAAAGDAGRGPADLRGRPRAALGGHAGFGHASGFRQGPRAGAALRPLRRQPARAQALMLGAKVRAAAAGRAEVSADDLAALAVPALRHRIILNFEGQAENIRTETLVESILQSVKA